MPNRKSPLTFFLNSNFPLMKNWQERRFKNEGYHNKLLKDVRHVLRIISGDNIVAMLNCVLTKNEIEALTSNYRTAIKNINQISDQILPNKKYLLIRSLKQAKLSRNEARRLNFKFSNRLWKTCSNTTQRYKCNIMILKYLSNFLLMS